ncbi:MAG: adenylosuccinate synthetase, partial [bacterium]
TKAYTTRVGEGPFPTELREGPVGAHLQQQGREIGATTGRPRRCGWFDAPVVRQAARLNGLTGLAVMKLDVLDGIDPLKIAVSYRDEAGASYDALPHWTGTYGELTPVYEELPGWDTPIRGITEYERLPEKTRAYLNRISELTGVPIDIVSTGPRREETIVIREG